MPILKRKKSHFNKNQMNRRKLIVCGISTPLFIASAFAANSKTTDKKPNIVLILLDDMGWSDLGCYGSEVQTPTIDSLAQHGLRYRQFYNAARSSPTRCALLTGLYTHQVAIDPAASLPNLRTDNNITIAELLNQNGYNTYMSGKWHIGTQPLSRGFQHAFGVGTNAAGSNLTSYWDINSFKLMSSGVTWDSYTGKQFYMTDATGDYAKKFIEYNTAQNDNKPFFLYLAFNASHWPIQAPADSANKYTDIGDPNPGDVDVFNYEVGWDSTRNYRFKRQRELGVSNQNYLLSPRCDAVEPADTPIPAWNTLDTKRKNDLARRMAIYAAMIHQIDVNVKKVVDELKRTNQLDNTIIMLLVDNGGNYEGGLYGNPNAREDADLATMGQPNDPTTFPRVNLGGGWANVANTPFRLFKHFTHEGGIRTPGIIFYPSGIKNPGRWIDQPAHLIDIMATVADLTGSTYPASFNSHAVLPLEGKSLMPHFNEQQIADRQIFEEHESNRAFFDGDYKFVTKNFAFSDGSSPAHTFELYNIKNDQSELNNLATQEPERLMNMIRAWNAKATQVGVPAARLISIDQETSLKLLFHYPFDGNTTDVSVNNYKLNPVSGYVPTYENGKYGNAIQLNGTSNYLDISQTDILNPSNTTFTVCAWVYNTTPNSKIPTTGNLEQQILHQLNGRIMLHGVLSANDATYGTWQGGQLYTGSSNIFTRNIWQHVAVVSNPFLHTHTFYVDGALAGTVSNAKAFENCLGGFRVGAHKTGTGSFWNGFIDELYLYAGALDVNQINKVMNNKPDEIQTSVPIVNDQSSLMIYPNPTSDCIYLKERADVVSVFSLNGALLMQANNCGRLNMSVLPRGEFVIKATFGSKISVAKVVKK